MRSIPITIAAYNDAMVEGLTGTLRSYIHPGDEVDLVSGNHDRSLSIATLNAWVDRLARSLPPAIQFAAHTSGLKNAEEIAQRASPQISSILIDYEPKWDPMFTWDFPATLVYFQRFAQVCRSAHRRAIAYPTGR